MIDLGELIVDLSILGVYPAIVPGGGTVTNVGTGTGLTGGPITGSGVISFAPVSTLTVLANITGGSAAPIPNTISDIFDAVFDNSQGDILYRGASGWTYLPPSTSGYFLATGGPSADPSWMAGSSGTVTQINSGLGLTGGPITSSGTLSLSAIAVGDVLANVGGFSAAPNAVSVTDLLDFVFSDTQGSLLYRDAGAWQALAPATSGYVLTTGGAAANPSWGPQTTGGSMLYVAPVLDVLDANLQTVTCTYYNGPGNDGIGATITNSGAFAVFVADGDTPPVGSPILVTNMFQANGGSIFSQGAWNGIYILTNVGDTVSVPWVLERRTDFNQTANMINGTYVSVYGELAQNYSFTTWILSDGNEPQIPLNVGTDLIQFNQAGFYTQYPSQLSVGFYPAAQTTLTPQGIQAYNTDLTLISFTSGNILLFGNGSSTVIQMGGGGAYPILETLTDPTNNITFAANSQIYNIGSVPILGLSASGLNVGGAGATVTSISTDGTFTGAVDTTLSSSLAIETYVQANAFTGLTGEVTTVGNVATLTNSAVTGQLITGFVAGSGTVLATDTILQAIEKLAGGTAPGNLTGVITSVGLVTSTGSQTGTGNTFVMSVSPSLTTPALGTPTAGVLSSCTGYAASALTGLGTGVATALGSSVTGSGGIVLATSPTLVTPALGTPSALVGTNITGTASGLTAGTVTTNANLTGDVTSVGNATTLTNAPVIAKVLTGFSAGAGTVSSSDSILTAFEKVVGNIAAITPSLTFVDQTSTPVTIVPGTEYLTDTGATLLVYSLPTVCAVGQKFQVLGNQSSTGLWRVNQATGQQCFGGNINTTLGATGYVLATQKGDCVTFCCTVANTTFQIIQAYGNPTGN